VADPVCARPATNEGDHDRMHPAVTSAAHTRSRAIVALVASFILE